MKKGQNFSPHLVTLKTNRAAAGHAVEAMGVAMLTNEHLNRSHN